MANLNYTTHSAANGFYWLHIYTVELYNLNKRLFHPHIAGVLQRCREHDCQLLEKATPALQQCLSRASSGLADCERTAETLEHWWAHSLTHTLLCHLTHSPTHTLSYTHTHTHSLTHSHTHTLLHTHSFLHHSQHDSEPYSLCRLGMTVSVIFLPHVDVFPDNNHCWLKVEPTSSVSGALGNTLWGYL